MQKELDQIIALQKAMGYLDLCRKSETFKMSYLRDIVLATHVELTEVLQEVPWKPWKPGKMTERQKVAAGFEITDVIVFALVQWAIINPDLDLDKTLQSTIRKIEKRIKEENYGNHS